MRPSGLKIERTPYAGLTVPRFHALLRLRVEVFVVEQQCAYAELDGRDPVAEHWWIDEGPSSGHIGRAGTGEVVAVARTYSEGEATVIGRVATRRDRRGQGLGRALVEAIVASGPRRFVLEAQAHLADWYRSMGFEVTGPVKDRDGIAHVPMALTLDGG